MDGIITNLQLNPSREPGAATWSHREGRLSVMMDLKQEAEATRHVLQGHSGARGGPLPGFFPRRFWEVREGSGGAPQAEGGHRAQARQLHGPALPAGLARRNGTCLDTRPGVKSNGVYFGPPEHEEVPQKALSVNLAHRAAWRRSTSDSIALP